MNNFYFTFGLAHKYGDKFQVIVAPNEYAACKKMFELHGREWGFQYTQEQWDKSVADGYNSGLSPLSTIMCEEVAQ